ncbi:MAG: pimeloyl-CoA dehydrogenase large subunit, partial [Rhodospirillales bacterium]|nr:pimeloyl-CoA dehydrogenase large subunit [Rhodospirillales bacterium]
IEAMGHYAIPYPEEFYQPGANIPPIGPDHAPAAMLDYLTQRSLSILGGSNEIQRNIISKAVLGL